MYKKFLQALTICAVFCAVGCSPNQTVKNTWKETRNLWYTYVSYPATIDYNDVGDMDKYEDALAASMLGIDVQLSALAKLMSNADKPPTNEWVDALFARFPWIDGFSGIKADGTIIGQMPGVPMKPLDFAPLLLEDKQQNFRALRGYVQDTPMGPEVFLATPLYDAHTFLGVVSVYFDMRNLLQYSANPQDLVILSPQALLWAGKYDFAQTPMAGIQWDKLVFEHSSGTVSNVNGTFYWTMIYFANQPLIFAIPVTGNFGEQTHDLAGPTVNGAFVPTTPMQLEESSMMPPADATSADAASSAPFMPTEQAEKAEAAKEVDIPIYRAEPPRRRVVVEDTYIPPAPTPRASTRSVVTPSPFHDAPSRTTSNDDATEDSRDANTNTTNVEESTQPDTTSGTQDSGDNSAPTPYRTPSPFGPR